MTELVRKVRTAHKPHQCDYCNCEIQAGEQYDYQKYTEDGKFWEWKAHLKCLELAEYLWSYINPMYDEMTSRMFQEGVADFCDEYVCPVCDDPNKEEDHCIYDVPTSIAKAYEFIQDHKLVRLDTPDADGRLWSCVEK